MRKAPDRRAKPELLSSRIYELWYDHQKMEGEMAKLRKEIAALRVENAVLKENQHDPH